ncbi:MAG: ATP-binding protein [Bacteroidales bacterium]
MLIITILFINIFSKKISVPINILTNAAKNVERGNYDIDVKLRNNDELKFLAESFNSMSKKIKDVIFELKQSKKELEKIVESIFSGLVVVTKNGKITLCNEKFKNITGKKDIVGRHYIEIIRDPVFRQFLEEAINKNDNLTKEIELYGKIYLCNATRITSTKDVVIVLNDITELKKVEELKKDFLINASHELKTPLTAIKGFIETLEEEEEIKNKEYIEIIKRHTERLINIVNDLIILSGTEQRNVTMDLAETNLVEKVNSVLKLFETRIKEKGLIIKTKFSDTTIDALVDEFKIEQMLINLIDNAVKYTEQGEIEVVITKENNEIKIVIRDTGIGIPNESLGRIFERFYVVDKSRSKKHGGTGLGLSIVKHIVLLHKGKIEVESGIGKGTKFLITLPKNLTQT